MWIVAWFAQRVAEERRGFVFAKCFSSEDEAIAYALHEPDAIFPVDIQWPNEDGSMDVTYDTGGCTEMMLGLIFEQD